MSLHSRKRRPHRRFLAAAWLGICLLWTQTARAEEVNLMLDWLIYGKHAAFYAGIERGFYKAAQIDPLIRRGFGSGDTVKAVGSGSSEVGLADIGSLIVGRGQGLATQMIWMIDDKNLHTLNVLADSGIRKPKDLKGKRLGSPVGNAVRVIFPAFAGANGLDPKGVIWVDMTAAAIQPSLLSGKTDVAPLYATTIPVLRQLAKKAGKEIHTLRYNDWGVDVYGNGLLVRDEAVSAKAAKLRRFLEATARAYLWSIENPDAAVRDFLKHNSQVNPALGRAQWDVQVEYTVTDGTRKYGIGFMEAGKMRSTLNLYAKYMSLKKPVGLSEIYTTALLPARPYVPKSGK